MFIAFVCFGFILPLHTASTIALSVCKNAMYTTSCAMMYSAASSASVADVMTCLIMWAMLRIAPLFCGIVA